MEVYNITCPQSIDFGRGPINAPGAFRPNSLNSTPASLKGKIVDELTKCKFANAWFYPTDFQRFKKIYDVNSNFKTPVTIGGVDEQSVEEIKYLAPRVFNTGDRFVTKEDHITGLRAYPGVAAANAWGEAELESPTLTEDRKSVV